MNNNDLDGSITIDEPSINRETLTNERINGCFVRRLFLISAIKSTITHKILETNSGFHVKQCTMGNF